MRRIARTVCCDLADEDRKIYDVAERKSKISKHDLAQIAAYFRAEQIKIINRAIERLEKKYKIKDGNRFIVGAGKFLYNELNASRKYEDLSPVKALYLLANDL